MDDSLVQIKGYTILRQDRNIQGGGVLLYVRKDLSLTKLVSSNTECEGKPGIPAYLFCSLQQGTSPPILVGVIYSSPKIAMQKESDLFTILRDLSSDFGSKIIMGDLNSNLCDTTDTDANTIMGLVDELSLQIVQHGPTHHKTPTTHTWIDLILTDANDDVLDHKNNWLPTFGKHAIIDVTIDRFIAAPPKKSFTFRNFKNFSVSSLNDVLSCCNWENMSTIETDLEGTLHNLNSNLNHAIDKLSPELRQLIDKRNATHGRYKRTGRAQLLDEFLRLSNEVDLRIIQERDSFLHKQLSAALDENKDIWREMRNLGLLPKRKEEDHHGFTPDN